ncbi:hypothetical protein [Massilia timonae]|uniref:hypothetical protein n=1 Tax=Massilia timonae TaxID=47229 RepID=UPI00161D4CE7|nr:hypothetical protein [Massilia timonae]
MKRFLISLCVTFATVVIIYCTLGVVAPDIYVEKAFVIIVYPSIAAGIVTALVWRPKRRPS